MRYRIETVPIMHLVGLGRRMSIANDTTPELWRALMPRRHEISNRATTSYVSMRVYPRGVGLDTMFAADTEFEKWAAVEVTVPGPVPDGMRAYSLPGGRYAVFEHVGPAVAFAASMRYIFGTWLPGSGCELDDREQFEVIPEGWNATDEHAREEIFIPVRREWLPSNSTA